MSDAAAKSWAVLFARLVLGLIFFMAGVWKVFDLGPAEHVRKLFLPFEHTFLPVWSLWAVGCAIIAFYPITEAKHLANVERLRAREAEANNRMLQDAPIGAPAR